MNQNRHQKTSIVYEIDMSKDHPKEIGNTQKYRKEATVYFPKRQKTFPFSVDSLLWFGWRMYWRYPRIIWLQLKCFVMGHRFAFNRGMDSDEDGFIGIYFCEKCGQELTFLLKPEVNRLLSQADYIHVELEEGEDNA